MNTPSSVIQGVSPVIEEIGTDSLWRRFWARKLARFFFIILVLLYITAFFAPLLTPYTDSEQFLTKSYHPPTRLVWTWNGLAVQRYQLKDKANRKYVPVKDQYAFVQWFAKGRSYRWLGLFTWDRHLFTVQGNDRIYLLGSDGFGRCIFSRLLYGSQISLSIGLIGIFITTIMGMTWGGIAGYFGGQWDTLLMRTTEVLMSIPTLYLILALRAVFSKDMNSAQIYLIIVLILSLIGWAGQARVIRGMTLTLRERDYVTAAHALGQNTFTILFRHIFPNTFSYIIVSATLGVPGYILGEAALSFLGLGIQDPQASWGLMLAQAQNIRVLVSFWWMLMPAVFISITVMAFNFIGDALRDAVDPRMKVIQR